MLIFSPLRNKVQSITQSLSLRDRGQKTDRRSTVTEEVGTRPYSPNVAAAKYTLINCRSGVGTLSARSERSHAAQTPCNDFAATSRSLQHQLGNYFGSHTLRASLSGTFLQTLPDLVTPLKGHSLSPRSCPATRSAPSERFGY